MSTTSIRRSAPQMRRATRTCSLASKPSCWPRPRTSLANPSPFETASARPAIDDFSEKRLSDEPKIVRSRFAKHRDHFLRLVSIFAVTTDGAGHEHFLELVRVTIKFARHWCVVIRNDDECAS